MVRIKDLNETGKAITKEPIVKKVPYGYALFEDGKKVSKTFRNKENAESLAEIASWLFL